MHVPCADVGRAIATARAHIADVVCALKLVDHVLAVCPTRPRALAFVPPFSTRLLQGKLALELTVGLFFSTVRCPLGPSPLRLER